MLTARSLFRQIHATAETYRLFCSIAASGEAQGGWENAQIAALVTDPQLAPKVARHGADEAKHGRIFHALLRSRELEPVPVPPETDYTGLLERQGIGLSHQRLRRHEPLSTEEIIVYLAHSRVTEQRGSEQMRLLRRIFDTEPGLGKALRAISADEDNHLAYCHEELLRLGAAAHGALIRTTLHAIARAEIRVYRDVSLAVMARMGEILNWPRWQRAVLSAGIRLSYGYEWLYGWRRLVRLRMPARLGALSTPSRAAQPPPSPA
jgi:hypothetical protein